MDPYSGSSARVETLPGKENIVLLRIMPEQTA